MMKYQDNQHFSHPHVLVSLKLDHGEKIKCNGCDRPIFEPFHGCNSCHYCLHDECLETPRFLEHPSHPQHPLTLLQNPTYPSRSFTCNACGSEGRNFTYSCAHCEFDLHTHCASLPKSKVVDDLHPHKLKLIFGFPQSSQISCDVCRGDVEPNFWMYHCGGCDFHVHLSCAKQKNNVKEGTSNEEEKEEKEEEKQTPENDFYKAKIRMMQKHLENKLMLQALDNAGDYVGGPSYKKETYYYY